MQGRRAGCRSHTVGDYRTLIKAPDRFFFGMKGNGDDPVYSVHPRCGAELGPKRFAEITADIFLPFILQPVHQVLQ